MTRRSTTEKVLVANATVTTGSGTLDTIISPQAGWTIGINQLIASDQAGNPVSILFYDGWSEITPQMTIGASGTMYIDEVGGDQLELSTGSGLFATSPQWPVDVQVTVYYVLHDERDPTTRGNESIVASTRTLTSSFTRTPNIFGGQSEG